ncbi:GAF and ANTAR domain-containing protein [Arthrobacter sp. zg-Y859]|uniref:GAF and ANTAR domain-containing protein n=1 Tax=Arthrobacter jinronghuae TaxID=2964609 RepID=A0ABT1NU20_9MICC|nr:GAF and ANTAR domain-containing protein [Arthrobacter jinronghuae]MCQ1951231.1 GAF and ANTAR domain-containing protein [Arthrobacter jinronghuae]UWX78995.1 GAF and ANTAR domain-containing protein [Arthrobacter jinronghuae]
MASPNSTQLPSVLIELVLESPGVQDFLNRSAVLAAREFSGPDSPVSCAVTLLYKSRPRVVASSSAEATRMDEIQYSYGDGPCLTAAHSGETVLVKDLAAENRWPDYTSEVSRHGLGSLLAVPITLSGDYLSALNLYADRENAFPDPTVQAAESFARHAASAVRLTIRITDTTSRAEDLVAAMRSRTTIDIAIGIIMGQSRCSQQQAFDVLRAASSHRNMKLREVAESVVASVNGRPAETHFEG